MTGGTRQTPRWWLRVFSLIGLADALYLSIEHLMGQLPFCPVEGCEVVLTSPYATLWGIPIAIFGLLFYLTIFSLTFFLESTRGRVALLTLSTAGLTVSFILVFLQLYIIKSICFYCLISAAVNALLFLTSINILASDKESPVVLDTTGDY